MFAIMCDDPPAACIRVRINRLIVNVSHFILFGSGWERIIHVGTDKVDYKTSILLDRATPTYLIVYSNPPHYQQVAAAILQPTASSAKITLCNRSLPARENGIIGTLEISRAQKQSDVRMPDAPSTVPVVDLLLDARSGTKMSDLSRWEQIIYQSVPDAWFGKSLHISTFFASAMEAARYYDMEKIQKYRDKSEQLLCSINKHVAALPEERQIAVLIAGLAALYVQYTNDTCITAEKRYADVYSIMLPFLNGDCEDMTHFANFITECFCRLKGTSTRSGRISHVDTLIAKIKTKQFVYLIVDAQPEPTGTRRPTMSPCLHVLPVLCDKADVVTMFHAALKDRSGSADGPIRHTIEITNSWISLDMTDGLSQFSAIPHAGLAHNGPEYSGRIDTHATVPHRIVCSGWIPMRAEEDPNVINVIRFGTLESVPCRTYDLCAGNSITLGVYQMYAVRGGELHKLADPRSNAVLDTIVTRYNHKRPTLIPSRSGTCACVVTNL